VSCQFRTAAVKVMALQTLLAGCVPRCLVTVVPCPREDEQALLYCHLVQSF
jgi:hypothetical protein